MRKMAVLLCFLLLLGSAHASVAVRLEDTAALLQRDGTVIVPVGIYEDIVSLGEGLFAAGSAEAYALMDASGQLLTEAVYEDLRLAAGTVVACREGFYGLLNAEGNEISEFAYSRIISNDEGFWALKDNPDDGESDELFILNPNGEEFPGGLRVQRTGEVSGGLLPVLLPGYGLWGYCDSGASMVIPAQYSYAGVFVGGCAPVVQNGKYGAIDTNGNSIVSFEYDYLQISPSGFILAAQNMLGISVLDMEGNQLAFYEGEECFAALAGEGYILVQGETLRIYNSACELIETAAWDAAVGEGLDGRLILSEGAWGEACVRISGTDARWQNLYPLGMAGEESLYACMQVRAARYVNDLLDEIQYAVDMESARYGVVNGRGELLLPCEYVSVKYIEDDRLLLRSEDQWQMSDSAGNVYWSLPVSQSEAPSF